MATIDEQKYATEYTGLISTGSLALAFITVFTVAFETFSRLPRNVPRKKRPGHAENSDPSVEDYTMAYLYRPRQFLGKNRGPPLPKWPFAWIPQVLRLSQDWYLKHSGLDSAVYIRFITGCWFFVLSQLCTTVVINLPLHIIYAPASVLPSSIAQASVSSLINSTTGGREYLWVRTVLLWWQTISWVAVVIYVGWGNIRMRREQILDPWQDAKDGEADYLKDAERATGRGVVDGGIPGAGSGAQVTAMLSEEEATLYGAPPPGTKLRGWRFRTVKVSNIPEHMRSEEAVRNYLVTCLSFIKRNPSMKFYEAAVPPSASHSPRVSTSPMLEGSSRQQQQQQRQQEEEQQQRHATDSPVLQVVQGPTQEGNSQMLNNPGIEQGADQDSDESNIIDHVLIVRKLTELHELVKKRREVQHELESAHVILAREVMRAVGAHVRQEAGKSTWRERLARPLSPHKPSLASQRKLENLEALTETFGSFLPSGTLESELWLAKNPEKRSVLPARTIWEALADTPQDLLDAYQPVTKLKVFRGQVAPSIDLYLTKLNLLTSLIRDLKRKPDSYGACDTAFVTFRNASDARLAKTELSWIRARGLACRVRMAPDTRDLDWDKLVQSSFRNDVLRAFLTHAGIWLGTFFWILPISALIGLVSLDNLSTRIPALADWLSRHARAKSLASSLIPTVIVTITNMLIPTIMIQVSQRAQTFVTLSKLHHATWCRYWKWVIINVVIAFCVGTALFTSVLGIFTGKTFSDTANNPLNVIASSFSNGAVFFVSYSILIIATQCFFELAQFMIPWFLFLGVRKATSPRQRLFKTEGRRFFSYTVAPNHTLIIAIILVFSLLNPLPICFVFLYFTFANLIFRDHFARLYWRVYYEQYGRLFYMRIMRYSLDALVLGQVVNMSLFFVLKDGKNGGACATLIPITIIIKLVLTRWYDFHMDAADAAFADVVCEQAVVRPSVAADAPAPDKAHFKKSEQHVRRLDINERLRSLKMPELSLRATLKFPMSSKQNLKAKHGPQAVLQRLAKRFQDADAYSELINVVSRDRGPTDREKLARNDTADLGAPTAEKALHALEIGDESQNSPVDDRLSSADSPTVLPHPKLQRDDRPDFSAPYLDPFLVEPVETHLWLPRDPLFPVDLDDTIEWHGRAIVSSEGGSGEIGNWSTESGAEDEPHEPVDGSEHQQSDTEELLRDHATEQETLSSDAAQSVLRSCLSPVPMSGKRRPSRILDGSEKIRLADEVRSRYAAEEGAMPSTSSSSATPDSATSLPRHRAATTSVASIRASTKSPKMPRSASVAQYPSIGSRSTVSPELRPEELRRVKTEIIDPQEKRNLRKAVSPIIVGNPRARGRSDSGSSGRAQRGQSKGLVSQSRALAHEVISEERREAVERRQQEDERMLSRIKHSSKWPRWLSTAARSEDVD